MYPAINTTKTSGDVMNILVRRWKAILILIALLVWCIAALNTPPEYTTLKIGDNVSSLAKEHGVTVANFSDMDNEDAAVFYGRTGDYWWNHKTIIFYENEADFVKSAGLYGKIYHQRVTPENDFSDDKTSSYRMTGFFDNYWAINKTTPGSIGKHQKAYASHEPSAIVIKQTDKEIEFYNDRWRALLWNDKTLSPGLPFLIALLIFCATEYIYRRNSRKRKQGGDIAKN
jgi:hypothetical protein